MSKASCNNHFASNQKGGAYLIYANDLSIKGVVHDQIQLSTNFLLLHLYIYLAINLRKTALYMSSIVPPCIRQSNNQYL